MNKTLDFSSIVVQQDNNCIKVNNCIMKVVQDYEFTYILQKTQIRAIGGASRLVEQVNKWMELAQGADVTKVGTFALVPHEACWASKIINHVLEHGKKVFI